MIACTFGSLVSAGASDRQAVAKLSTAITKLVTDYSVGTKEQDSENASVCIRGINFKNSAYRSFDNVLASLSLPKKDRALVQTVLSDDTALETMNATLAANASNITNYNSLLSAASVAQAASNAAVKSLALRLGLKF